MLPHNIKEKSLHYAINYPVRGETLECSPDTSGNPIRQQGSAAEKSPQNYRVSIVCHASRKDNVADQMYNQLPGEMAEHCRSSKG